MNSVTQSKQAQLKSATQNYETPPDFSQFKGQRLDKEPSRFEEMIRQMLFFCVGAGILLAMIFSLFYFV